MSEEPEAKITLTKLLRPKATLVEPAAQANPVNTVMQDPDVAILRCTNPAEAITYEKKLRRLAETAIKKFQGGPDAEHSNVELNAFMPQLICDFKDVISEMYQLVKHANCKVLKSIPDP